MSKKTILLIDGENILHQSFHKFEKLKSTDGKPSGAIFGFFKSLHMYLTRFEPDDVYISFDNGHSPLRMELLPNYKGHRKNISVDYESLQSQKAIIMKLLGMLRINYIFDKRKSTVYEGDDFLAYLAIKKFQSEKMILISSDKDFNQLLSNNLRIYNPRKDEMIRMDNCKNLFGYHSHETVSYLAMVGDTSDDIPGFPGIGPVKARKILDEGTIHKFLEDENNREKYLDVWERNRQLIDLFYFVGHNPLDKLPLKTKKKFKYEKFKAICIEYSLASFLTNEFIKPFKELQDGMD
nr:MAG: 5'-3' exonuclease [Bacteriophage sp.]